MSCKVLVFMILPFYILETATIF